MTETLKAFVAKEIAAAKPKESPKTEVLRISKPVTVVPLPKPSK